MEHSNFCLNIKTFFQFLRSELFPVYISPMVVSIGASYFHSLTLAILTYLGHSKGFRVRQFNIDDSYEK